MTKKIVVDTQIMIWAIMDGESERRPHLPPRAKALISDLEKDPSIKVVIPSVVVAEMICKLPEDERRDALAGINKRFIISDFDTGAALHYGELYYSKRVASGALPRSKDRPYIKADFMIVAGALANEADWIYSEDSDVQFIGDGFIPVQKLPEIQQQPGFFDQDE